MVQLGLQLGMVSLSVGSSDVATLVGCAQQFGGPFHTRFTKKPLQELILALNNNTDIAPRRYEGQDVYKDHNGRIMDMRGRIQKLAMDELSTEDEEKDAALGTIIACLSVPLPLPAICTVVAEAILLFAHGEIDEVSAGSLSLLESRVKKYGNAILTKDSMCNKKANALEDIRRKLEQLKQVCPNMPWHTVLLPPRTAAEEALYAPFLQRLLASRADDEVSYVRSTQLLGLALLMQCYGWMINVEVEGREGNIESPWDRKTGALTVVFSTQSSSKHPDRTYIESREDIVKHRQNRRFNQSTSCKANNLSKIGGLAICDNEHHAYDYRKAYTKV
ncbi:hypothetical protein SLS60_007414 [Paraconiothyrium brasiliense]|uniref:Uncharacterized protein n=1 Tax=Paraconiothyrium brasiliense TaxID=300254 RepID=A0ABR3R5D1_9PLEO